MSAPAVGSPALWRQLYAQTFLSLQHQYPSHSRVYIAHLAHDAADDAIAELSLGEFPSDRPILPARVRAREATPTRSRRRTQAEEIEDMRVALGLPPKRSSATG